MRKAYVFSALAESLRGGGATSGICDITISLEDDPGPIFDIHKYDVRIETSRMDLEMFAYSFILGFLIIRILNQ